MAEWSAAYINDLPDSAFACIDSAGRHYPHHDAQGNLDLPHLRAALSRVGDSSNTQCGKGHLAAHARSAGIGQRSELVYIGLPITKADASTGAFDAVISTPDIDRDGERVLPLGLRNRDEYLANPLVYWAHEWALDPTAEPIGRATRLDVFDNRIESSAVFAPTAKGQNIRALVVGRFVQRTSVGAANIDARLIEGVPTWVGWDLREYSVVPMPANTGAIVTGVKSALHWLADEIAEPAVETEAGLEVEVDPGSLLIEVTRHDLTLTPDNGDVVLSDHGRRIATIRRRRVATLS